MELLIISIYSSRLLGVDRRNSHRGSFLPDDFSFISMPSRARYLMVGKMIYETNFYVTALGIKRGSGKIVYLIFSNDYAVFF